MKNWQQYLIKVLTVSVLGLTFAACSTSKDGDSSDHSRRADSNSMYRVKSGDTLFLIARANGVSYQDIMRWNGLTNPNVLKVGWKLRVRPNASGSSSVTSSYPRSNTNGGVSVVTHTNSPPSANRDLATNPEVVNNLRWVWPSAGPVVKRFDGSSSKGIVFSGYLNDPVLAASNGEVIYAGSSLRGYGNMIVIKHNEIWSTVYANNNTLLVKQGDRVVAGQTIARMGNSEASRIQLYYEVRWNAKQVDPLKTLPARAL